MDIENKYGTLERQKELLSMMKDLHIFFVENNIQYSLAWGSLIGAIRENGFVPWDDDIDIIMDRGNYEKFLSCCGRLDKYEVKKTLWVNRIQLTGETLGVWQIPIIDIFVIDNVPENKLLFKTKLWLLRILQGMLRKKPKNNTNIKTTSKICMIILYYFGKIFPVSFKQNLYESVSKIGNKKDTAHVGCFNDGFNGIGRIYESDMLKNIELHPFEDTNFCITTNYDNYLRSVYGDYMTPPKESERVPLHML